MRQAFLSFPWIHHEEPDELKKIYQLHGVKRHLKKNTFLKNGGQGGAQVSFLLNGLGTFSFQTYNEKTITFALIIPSRALGDMDGFSGELVNVNVRLIRDSELLTVDRDIFFKEVEQRPELYKVLTHSLVSKQESNLEAMIACHTLDAESRFKVFLKTLLHFTQAKASSDWYPISIHLNHHEYASLINVSRVTISKLLTCWEEQGLMIKKGSATWVHRRLFADVYDWLEERPLKAIGA